MESQDAHHARRGQRIKASSQDPMPHVHRAPCIPRALLRPCIYRRMNKPMTGMTLGCKFFRKTFEQLKVVSAGQESRAHRKTGDACSDNSYAGRPI
jgi:hypothetical protein